MASDDLTFHIRQFVPNCNEGEEMEARCSLMKARDYAISLITSRCEPHAMDHAISARDVADEFVFADVPLDRLKIALTYCRHLVQCAFLADHLERMAKSAL